MAWAYVCMDSYRCAQAKGISGLSYHAINYYEFGGHCNLSAQIGPNLFSLESMLTPMDAHHLTTCIGEACTMRCSQLKIDPGYAPRDACDGP